MRSISLGATMAMSLISIGHIATDPEAEAKPDPEPEQKETRQQRRARERVKLKGRYT